MPMAKITPVAGEAGLYHVHFLDARVDPGFGGGRPGGADPGYDIGSGLHPGHGLPGSPGHVSPPIYHPGHPDHGLPSSPGHPANRPPGSGNPVFPDNSLPSHPPPQVAPGQVIVMVRGADGKWKYATLAPGSAPPKPLPEPTPPAPDQGLPPTGSAPAPTPTR